LDVDQGKVKEGDPAHDGPVERGAAGINRCGRSTRAALFRAHGQGDVSSPALPALDLRGREARPAIRRTFGEPAVCPRYVSWWFWVSRSVAREPGFPLRPGQAEGAGRGLEGWAAALFGCTARCALLGAPPKSVALGPGLGWADLDH